MAFLTHVSFAVTLFTKLSLACLSALILLVATAAIRRWQHNLSYRYIPGPKASSMLGYILDLHRPDGLDWHFQMTEKYGHIAKLDGGVLGSDALYITDPAALQAILVRGVNVFRQSIEFKGLFGIIHNGNGVGSVHGNEHKEHRKLIDPLFTTARVSRLTPLFFNVTHQLRAVLDAHVGDQHTAHEVDILDLLVRTSLEAIGQTCIGHTFDSFNETSKAFKEFHWALTSILPTASRLFLFLPYLDPYLDTWRNARPVWLRRVLSRAVTYIPWSAPHEFISACQYMYPVYQKLLEDKKELFKQGGMSAIEESATVGADLMTLIFKANWEVEKEDHIPDNDVLANMSSLVHGAQETTSSLLSRFVCLLADKPKLQARLRDEIRQAREKKGTDDDFSFSELNSFPLLDAALRETLRLFAPVTFVWRQTMEDTVVPLKFPIVDKKGTTINELLITKGTAVYLGLSSANRSKGIWGLDASEFKPERWMGKKLTEAGSSRLPGIYSNMMTFLGGPRACPGMRFAVLELKLVIAVLLESYSFERSEKDIDWKLYITLTPYVRGDDSQSQVPVKFKKL